MKIIPIPKDRSLEQDPPIGIELIKPRQDQPIRYGRRYRETFRPTTQQIIEDIGLL
jgi:hypothetical protein